MIRLLLSVAILVALVGGAEARTRTVHAHQDCNVLWPCAGVEASKRGERVVKAMGGFGVARKVYKTHSSRIRPQRPQTVAERPQRVAGQIISHPAYRSYGASHRLPWCGIYMTQYTGIHKRSLWLAREWAKEGHNAGGPGVGVIVVWRHHVGVITGQDSSGRWLVHSGNDGNAVRTRARSLAGVIAYRRV